MEKIMGLSLLWKTAWEVFPYFDRVTDWDETYRAFLPRAAEAETERALWMVYAEFMARLGDGHTSFEFPASLFQEVGRLPFELLYTEGGYLISACPKEWEGHLWARVISLNGRPFEQWIGEVCRYAYHVDGFVPAWRLGKVLSLLLPRVNRMETSAGTVEFSLKTTPAETVTAPAPRAARPFQPVGGAGLDLRLYEGNLLYAALPDCQSPGAPEEIAAALKQTRPRGVILDLRDNIGGMTKLGGQVAELFLSGEFHGCQKRTRLSKGIDLACGSQFALMDEEELKSLGDQEDALRCMDLLKGRGWEHYVDTYGAPGQAALFDGPCAVLTSRRTVSAGEDTLAFFRSNHRATVIGEATCGTTGTPLLRRVPGGGGVRVCSVGYRLLDGTEFIGRGIMPDLAVPAEQRDLAAGRDAQLDRALELLG